MLTSAWRRDEADDQAAVRRLLPLSFDRPSVVTRFWREARSQRTARTVLRRVRPDVTYVFNMRYLSRSVLFLAREQSPVAYFVSDPWVAEGPLEDGWVAPWQRLLGATASLRSRAARLISAAVPSRLVRTKFGALDLRNALFASHALRRTAIEAGVDVPDAGVIHWGVNVAEFAPRAPVGSVERFLFVGQLLSHKGAKTAVVAFLELCSRSPKRKLHLTLVGGAIAPDYAAQLHALVENAGMSDRVTFAGPIDREGMASVYADHDAFIFPSEWEEPFSIALVEAMAVGLPIVCTMTGGTPEIALPEHNVLAFEAGDASDCCRQMERILDVDLARTLQVAARATVEERFTIEAMVDAIELSLRAAAAE